MGNGGSKQDSGVSSSNGGSISCYLPRDIRVRGGERGAGARLAHASQGPPLARPIPVPRASPQKGSYGGDVYCLQRYLQRVGLLKSDPTGYYGEATQMAVQRWQAKNSLRDHKGEDRMCAARLSADARFAQPRVLPSTHQAPAVALAK